jgi:DNA repair protein RecN (Recombination protein N)
VTAEFAVPAGHEAFAILHQADIAADGNIVMRRSLSADGRSRAFINDAPVSVGLLKRVGDALVEIHGQGAEQRLFDPRIHRQILDEFGGLGADVAAVGQAYGDWDEARKDLAAAEDEAAQARRDEDYLRHAVAELDELSVEDGEEARLADRRILLQQAEKLLEAVQQAHDALTQDESVEARFRLALRSLERVAERAAGQFDAVITAVDRAAVEVSEAIAAIQAVGQDIEHDPGELDRVEERLFDIRAAARKHQVAADGLPGLRDDYARKLAAIDHSREHLAGLQKAADDRRQTYETLARTLGEARRKAAKRLDKAVARELTPLKLGGARFATVVETPDDATGNASGLDTVAFQASTNPGSPPGPLARVASGGELSRFMLAMKVALTQTTSVPTVIFDEIDRGVGGSTAAAVGDRLARLADGVQVMVITHSPQVAARGDAHWRVSKSEPAQGGKKGQVVTAVAELTGVERREEIARMLAGAEVTNEARAAAETLIAGSAA